MAAVTRWWQVLPLLFTSLMLGLNCDAFSTGYSCPAHSSALTPRTDTHSIARRPSSRIVMAASTVQSRRIWEETVYGNDEEQLCPRGYYLDSVRNCCSPLGLLGKVSQVIETAGPLKKAYNSIANLFGVDTAKISKLGVPFALSYSIMSQINGALTLSVAWYMTCQRTGVSPLVPGQWKALLKSYGTMYAVVQLLRPFRVAAAIAMSKLSKEFLDHTQEKLSCGKGVAIACQYGLGWLVWGALAAVGVSVASLSSGVPLWTAV